MATVAGIGVRRVEDGESVDGGRWALMKTHAAGKGRAGFTGAQRAGGRGRGQTTRFSVMTREYHLALSLGVRFWVAYSVWTRPKRML